MKVQEDLQAASLATAPLGRSNRQLVWARFRKDKAAVLGLTLVGFMVCAALLAPLLAKFTDSPNQLFGHMRTGLGLPKGPTSRFWFGADQVGRDLFIRVIYGARTSLFVAVVGTSLATVLGIVVGLLSGYYGGRLDTLISRMIDVWLSLPLLLFAVGLSTVCSAAVRGCFGGLLRPGLPLVTGIIVFFTWPYLTRIVRGQVISLREREFVEAARSIGASDARIMFSEVLPNLLGPILVYATLTIPGNILFEAALSFLGVGVPQSTPSWGRMLSDATNGSLFTYAWWMMLYPGLFLLLTTLAFYLVGDGVLDALDPRRRAR